MSGPYKLKNIPKSDTDQYTTITGKVECKHKGGGELVDQRSRNKDYEEKTFMEYCTNHRY